MDPCDLTLGPSELKINRCHVFTKINQHVKYERFVIPVLKIMSKNQVYICFTKMTVVTLTFDLVYPTSIGSSHKRAQRALGRSPEEKVNSQGEAIYRGPLILSTKYW